MIAAARLQAITESAAHTLSLPLVDQPSPLLDAFRRMRALGVPIASICAWGSKGCQRPQPFGPVSPMASHGICDTCKAGLHR